MDQIIIKSAQNDYTAFHYKHLNISTKINQLSNNYNTVSSKIALLKVKNFPEPLTKTIESVSESLTELSKFLEQLDSDIEKLKSNLLNSSFKSKIEDDFLSLSIKYEELESEYKKFTNFAFNFITENSLNSIWFSIGHSDIFIIFLNLNFCKKQSLPRQYLVNCAPSATQVGSKIFLVSGITINKQINRSAYVLNLQNQNAGFTKIKSLIIRVFTKAVTCANKYVFVLGGFSKYGGQKITTKCQKYDPLKNQWNFISPFYQEIVSLEVYTVNSRFLYLYANFWWVSQKIQYIEKYDVLDDSDGWQNFMLKADFFSFGNNFKKYDNRNSLILMANTMGIANMLPAYLHANYEENGEIIDRKFKFHKGKLYFCSCNNKGVFSKVEISSVNLKSHKKFENVALSI